MTIRLLRLLSFLCLIGCQGGSVLAQSNPLNPYAINTTPALGKNKPSKSACTE
jgi:hypothetical protein